jgi:hypothetical protein
MAQRCKAVQNIEITYFNIATYAAAEKDYIPDPE